MNESRRGFVKKAAIVGAVTAVGVVAAQAGAHRFLGLRQGRSAG